MTDLLAALNTGHEGGCATVHANSAVDVPSRIEGLALAAGMPLAAVHTQLASALDLVVHVDRRRDGTRAVREIGRLVIREGRALVEPFARFQTSAVTMAPGSEDLLARLRG